MDDICILPQPANGGNRSPPNLYGLTFAAEFLAMSRSTLGDAIHHGLLREYGWVSIPHSRTGSHTLVCTAVQLTQWLGLDRTRGASRWVDYMIVIQSSRLDNMLQAEIRRLSNANALPFTQEYLSTTPHNKLRWLSNYAHHGGRTE